MLESCEKRGAPGAYPTWRGEWWYAVLGQVFCPRFLITLGPLAMERPLAPRALRQAARRRWRAPGACATEQEVIRIACELHTAGFSSRTIAARLAEQGLYSRAGTVFTPSAILAMVAQGEKM